MKIIKTTITKPPKILLYGQHKSGKSQFAASCPNPIFIQTEDRLSHLSVDAFELATTSQQIIESLDYLLKEKHNYKTVVLDTIDWASSIRFNELCKQHGAASILDPYCKSFAFGGGYKMAEKFWGNEILPRLTSLNEEKKMMPVLISHYNITYRDDPRIGSYQYYDIDIPTKAGGSLVCEWCDVIAFLDWKTSEQKIENSKGEAVTITQNTGQRVLRLKPNLYWAAGQSYGLPDNLDLPNNKPGWPVFKEALRAAISTKPSEGNLSEVKVEKEIAKLTNGV